MILYVLGIQSSQTLETENIMVDADTGEREKMLLFSVIASVFAR
jgi:hypothetical protein